MMNILFLVLTFLAAATAVWYAAFYQSPMPGATYADTYVFLSIGAAVIFAGLFISGLFNRKRSNNSTLFE